MNCPLCNHNAGAHSKLGCFNMGCVCGETPHTIELRAELDDAIELAEETVGYASEYFQEKWRLNERLAELKAKALQKVKP